MLLSSRDLRLLLSHTPSPPSCLQATAPASQSRSPVLQRRRIRRAAAVRVLDERLESEAAPSKRQLPTQRIPRPSSPTAQHQYPAHSAELQEQPSHQQQPNLFDLEHLPEFSPSFAAWCPIGVAVAMGRMLLWIACIALDLPVFKNKRVVEAYLTLLGVKVTWHNLHLLPEGFHVMVSNHTACGDLMALFTLPQRYIHLITPAIPARAMNTKHLPVMLRPAVLDTYEAIAESAKKPTSSPVHLFPEGGLTNGSGMLQFSRGFTKFSPPGTPVVPVALRTHTPWGLRTHTLTSSFAQNLFLYSFCPQVHIEAVILPAMVQGEGDGGIHHGEGRGAFVKRVQQAIAQHLEVPVTDITIQQKRQMMKDFERSKRKKG